MNIEEFREACLKKQAATESFPFDEHTLVFKVCNKMFALLSLKDEPNRANLKADPEWSSELREVYPQIIPGWHMNKKHWNTVYLDDGLDEALILKMIDHSYDLICSKLTKKQRLVLDNLNE